MEFHSDPVRTDPIQKLQVVGAISVGFLHRGPWLHCWAALNGRD